MTLVKHYQDQFKISEASFDIDKEQFFCHVGMPIKNDIMAIKYTVWGDIMFELVPYSGKPYDELPPRIQKLWEKGQEDCYRKALRFAQTQYQFSIPKKESKLDFIKKIFGLSNYGQ